MRVTLVLCGLSLGVLTACFPASDLKVQRERVTRESHTARFPISSGAHGGIDCDTCHGAYDTFGHFSCVGCHEHAREVVDPKHASMSGYSFGDESCYACHPTGEGLSRDQHSQRYFPINTGTPHQNEVCVGCHLGGTLTTYDCIACHSHPCAQMDVVHQSVGAGYSCASPACKSCHPTGEALNRDAHTQRGYFPINAATNHAAVACANCHTGGDFSSFNCIDCHSHTCADMSPKHSGVASYACTSPACKSCHPDGTLTRAQHASFPITSGTPHQHEVCTGCHLGPTYAAFACIECHSHQCADMNSSHSGVGPSYGCENPKCLGCHPSGEAISRAQHSAQYFPVSSGNHRDIGCGECHTTGDFSAYVCFECHTGAHTCTAMRARHGEVSNFSCDSARCYSCHRNGVGGD